MKTLQNRCMLYTAYHTSVYTLNEAMNDEAQKLRGVL